MKGKKIVLTVLAVVLCAVLVVGAAAGVIGLRLWSNGRKLLDASDAGAPPAGRIHFLNTGSSDAILLESDGHFALVDSGEDSETPPAHPELRAPGYEQAVLQYLKDNAADSAGQVRLDFVLATHSHSDHMGGFDTILRDPDVTVERAYFKEYRPENIRAYERENWDNQEVYDAFVAVLRARGVEEVTQLPNEPFSLGRLTLQLFNTQYDTRTDGEIGENDNSIALLVTSPDGVKALLTGDLDSNSGDEQAVAEQVGKVDLLKLGHHGYEGSNTKEFLKTLSPRMAIITNQQYYIHAPTRWRMIFSGLPFYATVDQNGIIASFEPDGIRLQTGCMTREQMELVIPAQ